MTFTTIDAFVEHGDARVVLACDQCQEQVIAFDTLDAESLQAFEATEAHQCPPTCCACGSPLPEDDRAFAMLACSPCHRDDAEGTRHAVVEYIATLGPTGVMKALAASIAKYDARATIGKVA